MRKPILFITLILGILFFSPLAAQQSEPHNSPESAEVLEARAKEVGQQLRCVICKNVSIEDSDATMAQDMRNIVRKKIAEGASNEEVLDYMQTKYGDFVLLRTPVNKYTFLVWALPVLFLLLALIWYVRKFRAYLKSDNQA